MHEPYDELIKLAEQEIQDSAARRLFANHKGENKVTEAVRTAIQKTDAETVTATETVRKVFRKKAEAFRKAAQAMSKTKRYLKQVKKKPERAPSYQEEQKTERRVLSMVQ